ncbi:hypothetical protein GGR57DRAFT_444879 [Xylariaceae sp. FL1272]|nr:hypothetical protein GGR57DRAFT_444879 [Xylariaceae sp. FL1272]
MQCSHLASVCGYVIPYAAWKSFGHAITINNYMQRSAMEAVTFNTRWNLLLAKSSVLTTFCIYLLHIPYGFWEEEA